MTNGENIVLMEEEHRELFTKRQEIENEIEMYEEDDTSDLEQELEEIDELLSVLATAIDEVSMLDQDAEVKNLCNNLPRFRVNPHQDRINRLQIIKKELESIQEWHRKNDKQKNEHVKFKISVVLSLIEFLKTGRCETHKALLPNVHMFKNNPYPAVNMGIEDIHNREVISFVRNLAEVAFEDYYGYTVWSTHPSRRVNRQKEYTNAVKLVVYPKDGIDATTFDLKDYYGKPLIINSELLDFEGLIDVIAYSIDETVVMKHENLEITKDNEMRIDIPNFRTRLD